MCRAPLGLARCLGDLLAEFLADQVRQEVAERADQRTALTSPSLSEGRG